MIFVQYSLCVYVTYLMFRISVIKHVLAWPQLREILVIAHWQREPFDKADVRPR